MSILNVEFKLTTITTDQIEHYHPVRKRAKLFDSTNGLVWLAGERRAKCFCSTGSLLYAYKAQKKKTHTQARRWFIVSDI